MNGWHIYFLMTSEGLDVAFCTFQGGGGEASARSCCKGDAGIRGPWCNPAWPEREVESLDCLQTSSYKGLKERRSRGGVESTHASSWPAGERWPVRHSCMWVAHQSLLPGAGALPAGQHRFTPLWTTEPWFLLLFLLLFLLVSRTTSATPVDMWKCARLSFFFFKEGEEQVGHKLWPRKWY